MKRRVKAGGKANKNRKIFYIFFTIILLILSFTLIFVFIKPNSEIIPGAECKSNNDCVKIQTTCCSCTMGGEEVCVLKSKAKEVKAKDCQRDLMCIALYSCKIQSCFCNAGKCEAVLIEEKSELANPASVYCKEQGYNLEIRSDAQGNQYGICMFPDGSECEEWAYYRGECKPK